MILSYLFFTLLSFFLKAEDTSFIYSYDPKNKVDPFIPIRILPNTEKAMNRLQSFGVKEFRLLGTLMGPTVSALLLTPDDEGISVRVGDRVGNRRGRIVAIARDKIIIREMVKNQYSSLEGKRFEDVVLEMKREENGDLKAGMQNDTQAKKLLENLKKGKVANQSKSRSSRNRNFNSGDSNIRRYLENQGK